MAQDVLNIADKFIAPAARPEQAVGAAAARARRYQNSAYSANTQAAYDRAWGRFIEWAKLEEPVELPLPLNIIEGYLTYLAAPEDGADKGKNLSLSSVNLAAAAIVAYHEVSGHPISLDAIWRTRRGIRNEKGVAARRKAPPLRVGQVARMLDACGPDRLGLRDRAILALGFSAGLRRSEISGLRVDDIEIDAAKMRVRIRRSKTDQAGQGAELVIERTPSSAFCAVAAVEAWIEAAGLDGGPLFRSVNRWGHVGYDAISGEAIRLIVRNRAIDAGLKRDDFRAHSLRAGLATSAFELDVALADVAKRLRHRNPRTTQGYDRRSAEKDSEKFRVLFSEFANDPAPARPVKAGAPKAAIDDAELRELIHQAEAAQQRVVERLKQVGETK
jgi:integrase